MTLPRSDVTGVILCGGSARRFAGRDKPLALLRGSMLVEHVRDRLAPQVQRVVISCNRNMDVYRRWGDTVVTDAVPERGPLGGLLAGMRAATTPYVFVCPGDAPLLPTTLVERLARALAGRAADLAYPHDGERAQHLFALVRRDAVEHVRRFLDDGDRAVHRWVEQMRAVSIDARADRHAFVNVNSAGDLAQLNATTVPRQHGRCGR
jgi:molybdopterin-guanine dinucleotide biosynthesis protein A